MEATEQKSLYRIAPDALPPAGLAHATRLDGLLIETSYDLPVIELRNGQGQICAVLCGHVFDPGTARFVESGSWQADIAADAGALEQFIDTLSGGFFAVTAAAFGQRVYLDPGGNLPIFYATDVPVCASSVCELFDDATLAARLNQPLIDACITQEGAGSWIGGYLTAHRDVLRLLPNHYLDVATWTAQRFWPRLEDVHSWQAMADVIPSAAKALQDFTVAAGRQFPTFCTLTAGNDTRMLTAAARSAVQDITFFTVQGPGSKQDIHTARLLAERFGLKHRVIALRASSEAETAYWDKRVGYSIVEAPRRSYTSLAALAPYPAVLTGMYGEVGRCRLYRQNVTNINQMTITSGFVLDRLTLPRTPEVAASIDDWLATLKGMPSSVIMDLAFLELKFGAWAMGQHPATSQIALHLSPMAQRPVLAAFVLTAPEEKTTSRLFEALIRHMWPELMSIPINSYGDYRDQLQLVSKVFSPSRLRRYLRDRLARG